jgi:hypothetical protein
MFINMSLLQQTGHEKKRLRGDGDENSVEDKHDTMVCISVT